MGAFVQSAVARRKGVRCGFSSEYTVAVLTRVTLVTSLLAVSVITALCPLMVWQLDGDVHLCNFTSGVPCCGSAI